MNKKGIGPLVIPILLGSLLLVGIFGGWLTAYKINQTLQSIPNWVWGIIIILTILMLLPKKNK